MQFFSFIATPAESRSVHVSEHIVLDALYAHALPSDELEHARVRAGPGVLEITLFLRIEESITARRAAGDLCERMLHASRILADWRWRVQPVKEFDLDGWVGRNSRRAQHVDLDGSRRDIDP
jgi:hypothetical protein